MIKKLILRGFQPHKDLTLELDPITVLVGNNETGKSSVVRALKWLALNEWDGEAGGFINWDMDSCTVELHTDKNIITRTRGKDLNLYTLNDQEFRAFGTKVPEPIAKTLKLTLKNFQEQLDLPFWLMLNSGQAAEALNGIFDLSIIDSTISNASAELRQARMKVTVCEDRLRQSQKTKQELDWVVQANKDLKEIESLAEEIQNLKEEGWELELLYNQVTDAKIQEKDLEGLISAGLFALNMGEEVLKLDEQIESLGEILELEAQTYGLQTQLDGKKTKLTKYLAGKCPLCGRE